MFAFGGHDPTIENEEGSGGMFSMEWVVKLVWSYYISKLSWSVCVYDKSFGGSYNYKIIIFLFTYFDPRKFFLFV